jgi:hypothetical protein
MTDLRDGTPLLVRRAKVREAASTTIGTDS